MAGPITFTMEELKAHKETVPAAALAALRREADKILTEETVKVVNRRLRALSGDPHDFMSMGPYWWPNPDTPDGLPYVNRDGEVNPETKCSDGVGTVFDRVLKLAMAAFYFGDNGYSEYANRQLYDWFINPETKMNPNARYAQAIPGICDGRGVGLISFGGCYMLFDGIGVLDSLGLMDAEILKGVREWYTEFTNWMLTHEQGVSAGNSRNNHGCWYDANIIASAVFEGRPQLVRDVCLSAYDRRIRKTIRPDGSQPEELRRTKAMSYTFFSYSALLIVANIAERNGYGEYWGIDEERGHCIMKQAVDFIYPYVKNPESFPYKQIAEHDFSSDMAKVLLSVHKRYPNEGYDKKAAELIKDDWLWLAYPIK